MDQEKQLAKQALLQKLVRVHTLSIWILTGAAIVCLTSILQHAFYTPNPLFFLVFIVFIGSFAINRVRATRINKKIAILNQQMLDPRHTLDA